MTIRSFLRAAWAFLTQPEEGIDPLPATLDALGPRPATWPPLCPPGQKNFFLHRGTHSARGTTFRCVEVIQCAKWSEAFAIARRIAEPLGEGEYQLCDGTGQKVAVWNQAAAMPRPSVGASLVDTVMEAPAVAGKILVR